MKLKYTLAALAATALSANATTVLIDNFEPVGGGTDGSGGYTFQSFTANVAGVGTADTVAANLPLATSVDLLTATFRKAASGAATGGSLFVNVYSGTGVGGTFLGTSSNSIDVNGTAGGTSMVWLFSGIALDSSTEYSLAFSTTATDDSNVSARIAAANNGAGFNENYYTGGQTSVAAQDLRFQVTVDSIPEPSSTALLGLGGLALILRRRK